MSWYVDTFGFQPDPFPEKPPYGFAILRRDDSEIMLQCADVEDTFHGGERKLPQLPVANAGKISLAAPAGMCLANRCHSSALQETSTQGLAQSA
jgi:hypothetical protein